MTTHLPNERTIEQRRLFVVLATVVINVVAVSLLPFASWSDWRTGLALNTLDNWLLIRFALRHRDAFMWRLLLFGLAVGIAELPADAWLVDYTGTLDYSLGGGPMIWRSPIWMPLAWEIVAVQFGYLGLRLWERFGGIGLAGIALLGALNIPFYEEMARRIHWWQYRNCHMISYTPYYIIVGELGIALVLAIIARALRRDSFAWPMVSGALGGAAIFACYALAFLTTDRWLR